MKFIETPINGPPLGPFNPKGPMIGQSTAEFAANHGIRFQSALRRNALTVIEKVTYPETVKHPGDATIKMEETVEPIIGLLTTITWKLSYRILITWLRRQ